MFDVISKKLETFESTLTPAEKRVFAQSASVSLAGKLSVFLGSLDPTERAFIEITAARNAAAEPQTLDKRR